MSFPRTTVLDNFNRANEGPPPSSSWVTSAGTGLKVSGNVCTRDAAGEQAATWNTLQDKDQEAFFTIATNNPDHGLYAQTLVLRLLTANSYLSDHYEVNWANDSGGIGYLALYRVDNSGTFTQLGATVALSAELVVGNQLGARMHGAILEAYLDGQLVASRTDATLSHNGYIGLRIGTTNAANFENFGGGVLRAGTPFSTRQSTLRGDDVLRGVAGLTEAIGSSSGAADGSGVGAAIDQTAGSAAGVGAASGAGAAIVKTDGAGAGAGASSGEAAIVLPGAASSAGAGAATGVGVAIGTATGASDGVGAASGDGQSTAGVVGASAGAGVASGSASAIETAIGSASGQAAEAVAGAALAQVTGDSTGVGSATGAAAAIVAGVGSAVGIGAAGAVGEDAAGGGATGSASGSGTAAGVGAAIDTADGSAAGTGAASGDAAAIEAGAGSSAGIGAASGQTQELAAGTGSSVSSAAIDGQASAIVAATGAAAGTGAAQGEFDLSGQGIRSIVDVSVRMGARLSLVSLMPSTVVVQVSARQRMNRVGRMAGWISRDVRMVQDVDRAEWLTTV